MSYTVNADNKSITFDLPKQVLAAGTNNKTRDLTLTIPASFKSTGRIEFTFEKVVVAQDGGGFSETYDRTQLNASKELDYSVRVGWAASSIEAQNGKALMGYLTEKDAVSGKFGIQFEYAFNYNTSPMKDFASKTDAKWSYYKDKADRLTFVEGMTSIGDYAFPDFELVTSLSLPESLVSVGKWSFDNISIPTLTLPAALTNFDTMSFGHINELTEITFNQAAKTDISFPTAGSTTGAFYVDPYVPTKIVGENPIAQGYDWITDQRRVAPVIRSYNYTWSGDRMSQPLDATTLTPDDDSNVDFHTAENRAKIKSVVFQDASGYYAIPDMKPGDAGGLVEKNNNMWDVSAAQNKSVIAWLKDDGTLIIAGDGVKVMANADSDWLFGDMANIETIDATLYDTSNATTMEYWHAFAEPDLRQNEGDWSGDPLPMEVPQRGTKQVVGIQDWDVSKVTSTMDMFYNANRLTSLNLGSWNTKSLKTPNGMFHGCSALTTLDVSGWNTSNVTTLQSIFSHCRGLTALDVAGWDVQKVTDMSFAFSDCGAPVLDLHTWKTNSLTTLEKAFAGAGANTINVTGWNTSKVITMDSAFENTASLGSLDLSTWDTSGVGRGTESDGTVFGTGAFNNMFFRSGAKSINVSGFDFSSLYGPKGNWNGGLYKMFGECKSLTEIVGAETWTNTGKIVELNSTFIDCEKLVTLNVSKWDTSGVTAMSNAFNGCKSLAELDVSKWDVSSCEGYINTFKDCESVKVLDISKWDMTKATPSASQNMFNGCKSLESLTFPTSVNWLATRMAANCPKLTTIEFLSTDASISQRPTAGASLGAFYVAPDAGVTVPVTTFIITHGSGMAQLKDASIYNLADDNRCLPLDLPVQSETLTYTGSEQSPTWKNYDSSKMTISGTTTAVNADTYTAKFTPKTGYAWEDGTTGAKSVTWKIGKAAGSLFVTPTEMTIALNDTTGTITVTRAGDGAITATSDKASVATVEVNGNKITVTKKGAGTANITVKVAEGTNHKAPAGKTVVVTCKTTPELNAKNTWYTGSTAKSAITEIELKDSYTATGNEIESWDASAAQNKTVMAYVVEGTNGKKLILAGNGSGKIVANADSTSAFNGFTALTAFTGLNKLDTSNVTNMQTMFNNLDNIQTLDLSSFNTSKVTNFYSIFGGNDKLTTLNLTGWDTSAAKDMGQMFYVCNALTTINGLSSFNTANVTDMSGMFHGCKAMTSLDVSGFDTSRVTDMSYMFSGCSKLTSLDVSGFDTSKVADMRGTFYDCTQLKSLDVSGFDTSSVTDMYGMFYDCSALTSLDLSGFDTSSVTNMSCMFDLCKALTSLDLSGFDTSKVTTMGSMFESCGALTSLDLSGFDTSQVTNMSSMFLYCKDLTSLDLSGFDTSQVTSMRDMFEYCTKLQAVTLGKDFKFVGTDGYLYTPSSTYISGADGKWYDTNTGTGYTPEALASVERTEAVTYSAVPNAKILSGMWKFNVKPAECPGNFEGIYFTSNGVAYSMIGRQNFSSAVEEPCKYYTMWYAYAKTTTGEKRVLRDYSWDSAAYRLISFNGPQVVTEEFYNWFVANAKPVVTLEGKWKFNETLTIDTEVEATEISYTFIGRTGTYLKTFHNESGKFPGWNLSVDSGILEENYVYLEQSLYSGIAGWQDEDYRYISFNGTQHVTKDFYDWFIANAKPWSEDESGAAEKIAVPKQSGTLTYNGSAQSPSWSSYDASKMTMGGTTAGTNAGSYTTTFTPKDGFKWADGTTGTKSVIWKIGKTTGSVSFSKDSLSIDKNSTTDTLDVTRTGTGAITATSSDTSVATVTVNGTKVTVTKVGDGTATITIKVAADTNYKEASKTCSVTCVGIPTLAYGSTWYKGSTDKASITKIQLKDSYTPSGTAAESWNADARNSGSIKAYVEGTTLTIAGNGTGKIKANALSWSVFNGFSSAAAITGIDLMDTSNALTMEAMFYGCKALTALDVSKFDTSNVTSMRAMFYECENLTSLNVSKFDTASVTNVEAMFQGCKALTAVGDVSGWNTAKVTSMYQVFYGCEKLAALDLSGWNTTNVTNMQAMFLDCTSLTSVGDISGWNTAKVTEMALLFGNCEKLASLDVSKFNTAAVTNMNAMFFNCSALTTLDVSGFDTAKTTNLAAMFSGCVSLTSLDVSNWNTSNVTTMEATFQNCKKLTTMGDVSSWDTSKVTNMREMFCQCNLITSVDVTNWKTGNVTNMNGIFSNCEKLTSVGDLSGWDTSSATDMGWIFNSCFKLTGMGDISQWDTSNATKMNCLFATCESLTELDLSGWDTSKVTDMNNIFGGYEHEQHEESEIAGECVLLRKITLGAKFKFVGTDSYLPEPDSRYISGADGKWYAGSTGYTPAELAGLSRTEAVTYVAVKGTKTMSILSGDNAVSGYSISE